MSAMLPPTNNRIVHIFSSTAPTTKPRPGMESSHSPLSNQPIKQVKPQNFVNNLRQIMGCTSNIGLQIEHQDPDFEAVDEEIAKN